jgi:hypothetical protein
VSRTASRGPLAEPLSQTRVSASEESLQKVTLGGRHAGMGRTELEVSTDGLPVGPTYPGVPVASRCKVVSVAVAWSSGSVPGGPWTVTFWRRPSGGVSFSAVGTFDAETS